MKERRVLLTLSESGDIISPDGQIIYAGAETIFNLQEYIAPEEPEAVTTADVMDILKLVSMGITAEELIKMKTNEII